MGSILQTLFSRLNHSDQKVRVDAILALGKWLDATNVDVLVPLLTDPDDQVRAAAASSAVVFYEKYKELGIVNSVVSALEYEDPNGFVVQSVGSLGSIVIEPLISLLKHSDKDVRARVVFALSLTHDPIVVEPLIYTMAYDEDQDGVANDVLVGIGHLGVAAILPLVKLFSSDDPQIRRCAVMASGFITHHLYQRQVSMLYDPDFSVRYTAITALVQDGRLQAIDQLQKLADSKLGVTEWGGSIAEEARKAIQEIKSRNQLSWKDLQL